MSPDDCAEAIRRLAEEIQALRSELRVKSSDDLLTVKQAAKVLNISERAVRMGHWRGTILGGVKIGGRLRFRRGELVRKE